MSIVCTECGTPVPENAAGLHVEANSQEGVILNLCDNCLAFECESCGKRVVEVAQVCDSCSRPVCSSCFEKKQHGCCLSEKFCEVCREPDVGESVRCPCGAPLGFRWEGFFITDPTVSECGRFAVVPEEHYGVAYVEWRRQMDALLSAAK